LEQVYRETLIIGGAPGQMTMDEKDKRT
jgi:hypothetical protein